MPIPSHPQTIRVQTRIPQVYRPPLGLPLRWQDDVSGELPAAVRSYLDHRCGESPAPPAALLDLLIDYLRYHITAPCWSETARMARDDGDEEMAAQLIQLRLDICEGRVRTPDEIGAWIHRCLSIGIDPL
jgi:hypothetical protein